MGDKTIIFLAFLKLIGKPLLKMYYSAESLFMRLKYINNFNNMLREALRLCVVLRNKMIWSLETNTKKHGMAWGSLYYSRQTLIQQYSLVGQKREESKYCMNPAPYQITYVSTLGEYLTGDPR